MRNKARAILLATILAFLGVLVFSNSAHAEKLDKQYFVKKASLQGLFRCGAGETKKSGKVFLSTSIDPTYWTGTGSLYTHAGTDYDIYKFPTDFTGLNETDCDGIINEHKGANVFDNVGLTVPTGMTGLDDFLTKKMGYVKSGEDGGATNKKCFHATWRIVYYDSDKKEVGSYATVTTSSLCLSLDSSDVVVDASVTAPSDGSQGYDRVAESYMTYLDGKLCFFVYSASDAEITQASYAYLTVDVKGKKYDEVIQALKDTFPKTYMHIEQPLDYSISGERCTYGGQAPKSWWFCATSYTGLEEEDASTSIAKTSKYEMPVGGSGFYGGIRPVAGLTGYSLVPSNFDDMTKYAYEHMYFTQAERVQLYVYYMQASGAKVTCYTGLTDDVKAGMRGPIKYFADGSNTVTNECYAEFYPAGEYNGLVEVDTSSFPSLPTLYRFDENATIDGAALLDFFANLPDNYTLDFEATSSTTTEIDPGDAEAIHEAEEEAAAEERERNCYDAAGSSNWIACPIIENGTSASIWMYKAIDQFLQVNTTLFKDSKSTSGTFGAWSVFRDIANIVFVGVFIIVILSQVTGFGIDNYGIKKILPKLVLGALLVNVSYFMCQASVDIGNILGGGVKDLLNRMQEGLAGGSSEIAFAFGGAKAVKGALTGGAALILVAIVGAAFYVTGGEVIIPILLGVIAIVIGILFLLVLLAVRQGLAVILVTISPLAFVAYMLPNTRPLFSKWLKLLSGVLLAYPICSMVIYGGQMVSTIILLASAGSESTVTNIALALTSAILSIAPVFFIPSLISKSMSGISTVANGLKARATSLGKGAFDRSNTAERMRDVADMNKDTHKMRRANRSIENFENPNRFRQFARRFNKGKPVGAELALLRNAQRTKTGIDKKRSDLYSGMTNRMDKDDLINMVNDSFADGNFNAEQYEAGISALAAMDANEANKLISKSSAIMKNSSKEDIAKWKNANRSATSLGKAMSKVWNSNPGMSYDAALSGGQLQTAFNSLGDDALANMDPDELEYWAQQAKEGKVNLEKMFNAKQVAAALAAHNSGKNDDKMRMFLQQYSGKQAVIDNMTAMQWSKLSNENSAAAAAAGTNDSVYTQLFGTGNTKQVEKDFAQQLVDTGDGQAINSVSGAAQKGILGNTQRSVQKVKF